MTKGPTTLCKTPHRKPRKDFILNIFPKQNDNAYPSSIQIYLVTHSLQFIRIKWLFVLCLSDKYSRRVYYNSVSIMINQSIMINNHLLISLLKWLQKDHIINFTAQNDCRYVFINIPENVGRSLLLYQSFGFEHAWWRFYVLQVRVVLTYVDIYFLSFRATALSCVFTISSKTLVFLYLDRSFTEGLLLTWILCGFLVVMLKSSLRQFYCRHHNLVNRYGISMSQMATDMFHVSSSRLGPFLTHDLSPDL